MSRSWSAPLGEQENGEQTRANNRKMEAVPDSVRIAQVCMKTIRLPHGQWMYDPAIRLGREGGFGIVFAGAGEGFGPLAIKRLKVGAEEAGHRELRIAEELAWIIHERTVSVARTAGHGP
jgi:hypothetical protein